ncbi:MAG: phosphoglucosamine mutase [Lentisphaerae bacterium]|nr:phosphoglucosamine mutase [Victivallaceae bacterium]MDD3704213.1 phosphoglucosamine mutase [Victivallaceae bacterium]NLK83600.1 phosphoglucosamine mutase [Lentisphaerota bacterium]
MGKLFGTDGVRGRANTYPVTPDMAMKIGRATAAVFGAGKNHGLKAVVGKDTRLSGYMLEKALVSGLLSMGMDVLEVGPMPTPAVAHLIKSMGATCGFMITASHNPAHDNGIKIFGGDGFKLPDATENKIEKLILEGESGVKSISSDAIGRAARIDDARGRYIEFAKSSIKNQSLKGLKIVLDCANGAAYSIAPLIFRELGAEVIVTANTPDGLNINDQCGALHFEHASDLVRKHRADVGISLDGDADRVIFCDGNGNEVNGDRIIGLCALDLMNRGHLAGNSVVVTNMSNLGLYAAMSDAGIKIEETQVGDRYVIERMRSGGYNLGGEQSGHIIFMDYATTGDGIITALHVLKIMISQGKKLHELADFMSEFPQVIKSIPVKEKKPIVEITALRDVIIEAEKALAGNGRTIVRYSGTEPKIRVLVEARSQQDVDIWLNRISEIIKRELQ